MRGDVAFRQGGGRAEGERLSLRPPVWNGTLRGRESLLAELAGARAGAGPRVRVLHGLGGCGKTSVASRFAEAAGADGVEVWWIAAHDPERLDRGLTALARTLGLTEEHLAHGHLPDLVWRALAAHDPPWLLVFDNADTPAVFEVDGAPLGAGTGWLREPPPQGLAVVTTREGAPRWWDAPWCARHPVPLLPTDAAADVLRDLTGPDAGPPEDAARLADRLGHLPLALRIAGSYLAAVRAVPAPFADPSAARTYASYTALLTSDALPPLATPDEDQDLASVAATWRLSLDLLATRGHPHAAPLLTLLARFAEAPIPYFVLPPDLLAASSLLPDLTGPALWKTLTALADVSLVDLSESDLLLHPLVRTLTRIQDPDPTASLALTCCLLAEAALSDPLGQPEDPTTWPLWRALTPHTTDLLPRLTPTTPPKTAADLCTAAQFTARFTQASGNAPLAEAEFRALRTTFQLVLGEDHPDALATRHSIAYAVLVQGRYGEAETELRTLHTTFQLVLGEDHPDALATRNNLAYAVLVQGRYGEAETELRALHTTRQRVLGEDHPDTLTTRHNLASTVLVQGRYGEAETELRALHTTRQRVLGEDHPDTLTTRHNLAYAMLKQGRYGEAETELRTLHTTQQRVLGEDHPNTLTTRHNLAYAMLKQGREEEARREFQAVLEAQIRVLGNDHPDTQATRRRVEE
ncbi:tetratricopeptide repeat protein [Actinocorallia sp. API 0066]|uniref:tetratricopeptide repeat protein n=1 Tax=Actinocorallia sp. API 0066 TaxID=2896846 RepID=UPI001E4D9742|nr:tetratricopeptide repeat protein [Actinocorallia sp. API 0066]MCD0450681.1 tetratricopeptide repeat protein [Actinocorallia sp. API 0066]